MTRYPGFIVARAAPYDLTSDFGFGFLGGFFLLLLLCVLFCIHGVSALQQVLLRRGGIQSSTLFIFDFLLRLSHIFYFLWVQKKEHIEAETGLSGNSYIDRPGG